MHADEPLVLPDVDNGLRLIRWWPRGFDELRRRGLIHHPHEFELVEGLILEREWRTHRHDRLVAELARRLQCVHPSLGDVLVETELRLEEHDSVLLPDITVIPTVGALPSLVVEVTEHAPRLDGKEKERLYARAGIEQYWHIDLTWPHWQTHNWPHPHGYGGRSSGPSDRPTITCIEGFEDLALDALLAAADAA